MGVAGAAAAVSGGGTAAAVIVIVLEDPGVVVVVVLVAPDWQRVFKVNEKESKTAVGLLQICY